MYRNFDEARATWLADRPELEARGVFFHGAQTYACDEWTRNPALAMDALPALVTDPNAGVPAALTAIVYPEVTRVIFSPLKATEIFDEERIGEWERDTAYFPMVEPTGETSSYGDYNNNGRAGINAAWPERQLYRWQLFKAYGDLEMARAALAKIDLAGESDRSAAEIMARFMNNIYFFGVGGLQLYGITNDPKLNASIAPGLKANGNGNVWVFNGHINASANEVYDDILALYQLLVNQTGGNVDQNTPMRLCYGSVVSSALDATNSFGVNVRDLISKNFPNMTLVQATQYNVKTSLNPQGIAAGNMIQLIAPRVLEQKTGSVAYAEKYRTHPMIREPSAYKQKVSAAAFGAVIRVPSAVASMIGV